MDHITPHDPEKFEQFCELKAQGETYDEMSLVIGISSRELKRWYDTIEATEKIASYRKKFKTEDLLAADKVVRRNSARDNLKAAELIYKREGELVDKKEVTGSLTVSADDIRNLIDKVTNGKD